MATIFISYSHLDKHWKQRLERQLKVLVTTGTSIVTWTDDEISAGQDWFPEITQTITACDVAVMLISANFLTSNFIQKHEIPPLLLKRKESGAKVVPLILSPCPWDAHAWLESIQVRPREGKPLTGMSEHEAEQALCDLAREIKSMVAEIEATKTATRIAVPVQRPPERQAKLYGREALLKHMETALKHDDVLALYGFRGNGKSALIRELQKIDTGLPRDWQRLNALNDCSALSLFRRLATSLGARSERPTPPGGSVREMASALQKQFPHAGNEVIWIENAHLWFHNDRWDDQGVGDLFQAMRLAFKGKWRWVFELWERPAQALTGAGITQLEVPGLDKSSLADWLTAEAPEGQASEWRYTGDRLKQIYQWLGGGHGKHAHPLTTHILIQVAHGRQKSPLDALREVLNSNEGTPVEILLADLHDRVLSLEERALLQALSLYRHAIPQDHINRLEKNLPALGAGEGLQRRLLLASDANLERHYLHGFVAGWMRERMGYPDSSVEAGTGARSRLKCNTAMKSTG